MLGCSDGAVNQMGMDRTASDWEANFFYVRSRRVSAELTLRYGSGSVGAVRQLVGLEAGHGRGWESTRNEVVEGHQLTSSSLLPPTGSSVAEPHLQRKQDKSIWFSVP